MDIKVYVDILLVINYIINTLLILCTAKLTGRRPKRRRIVAAALLGSASALTIFLPFMGFTASVLLRLGTAAAIVLAAFAFDGLRVFAKQLFVFFAVSFFFSGVMLAVWIAFSPQGMLYYNGVVYFDISALTLIATSAAAYGGLTLANRFSRGGRVRTAVYEVELAYRGRTVALQGLVDTGNSLYEPFSDIPVMLCNLDDIERLLPPGAAGAIRQGGHLRTDFSQYGLPVRLIPFDDVGGGGMVPAFRPDQLLLSHGKERYRVEAVFVGIVTRKIGGAGYNSILNPDLIGLHV